MNIEIIGQVVKDSRIKKKLTQQEVADKIEISRNYISDIENGRYIPSVATLSKIVNFLEIDLKSLSKMTEIQ